MITVYTRDDCDWCTLVKNLLSAKNKEFTEILLGRDISTEDFKKKFPEQTAVPFILFDNEQVTGYTSLKNKLESDEGNNNASNTES